MARAIPLQELTVFTQSNRPVRDFDYASGAAFVIHKPKGWTSFKVVAFLRKCLNLKKIGHAGTLDPMAEGVLILCCGRGTRTISQFQELKKVYTGEVTLGATTPSRDAETEIEEEAAWEHITREDLDEVLETHFSGEIMQVPPMYSALKHQGKPLYKLARKGQVVERKPRQVSIYKVEVLDFALPKVELRITCSKGTYIRSIAYDLGRYLDSLGYLSRLERNAIGSYTVEEALSIEDLNHIFLES